MPLATDSMHPETYDELDEQKRKLPRSPLGWPPGSVRALLTLIIVGYVVNRLATAQPLELIWTETLMIVLAHYFTSRRFVPISPKIRAELEATGEIEADQHPLGLPKHSIRTIIFCSFAALGIYLYQQNLLWNAQTLEILGTVGAYFLGILYRTVRNWFASTNNQALTSAGWFEDLKALAAILLVGGIVSLKVTGLDAQLPIDFGLLEGVSMGFVLFYFGSR